MDQAPAPARAASASTRLSAEGRPRVQHSRWKGRTRRRQEAVRGEAAPSAIPRKDTLVLATLQVLPFETPERRLYSESEPPERAHKSGRRPRKGGLFTGRPHSEVGKT